MARTSIHATLPTRLRQLRRDERGFSLVTIGFGFMGLFAASMLAIDVGMLMTSRTQAQNAADSGALAGATALVFNSWTNRSATGPAVVGAMNSARANRVAGQDPSVIAADVTFPMNAVTGQSDLVEVTVHRTAERSNPVATLIAQIFGIASADIRATATATAAPADSINCPLPFTIPDKWIEKQCGMPTCPWSPSESFNTHETQGSHQNAGPPLPNPDIYHPPGTSEATGYNPVTDRGMQLVLKPNNHDNVGPSFYNAWALPGSTGADDYRENIYECNPNYVDLGHLMTPEPGNMTGPTSQGTADLVAQDPNAYWDTTCNCVKGSAYAKSPRIRAVPLYNPVRYADNQHAGRSQPDFQVVNYLGFFIEEVNGGGEVIGRITPITGRFTGRGGPNVGGFAQAIMLVR
jgi:Flp pilus assembly protein TadG